MALVLVRLNHLEDKMKNLKTELTIEKQKKNILRDEKEISNLKLMVSVASPANKMEKGDEEVDIDGRAVVLPRNCQDLATKGHGVDGIYLIQSANNAKKIGAVYCDFSSGNGSPGRYFSL